MYKDFHGCVTMDLFIVAARFRAVSVFNSDVMDYFLAGGSSSFAAILTKSASDSARIFRITCPR